MNELQDKVWNYLIAPNHPHRTNALRMLSERGFFGRGLSKSDCERTLMNYLGMKEITDGFCAQGIKRFTDAVLAPPAVDELLITIRITSDRGTRGFVYHTTDQLGVMSANDAEVWMSHLDIKVPKVGEDIGLLGGGKRTVVKSAATVEVVKSGKIVTEAASTSCLPTTAPSRSPTASTRCDGTHRTSTDRFDAATTTISRFVACDQASCRCTRTS